MKSLASRAGRRRGPPHSPKRCRQGGRAPILGLPDGEVVEVASGDGPRRNRVAARLKPCPGPTCVIGPDLRVRIKNERPPRLQRLEWRPNARTTSHDHLQCTHGDVPTCSTVGPNRWPNARPQAGRESVIRSSRFGDMPPGLSVPPAPPRSTAVQRSRGRPAPITYGALDKVPDQARRTPAGHQDMAVPTTRTGLRTYEPKTERHLQTSARRTSYIRTGRANDNAKGAFTTGTRAALLPAERETILQGDPQLGAEPGDQPGRDPASGPALHRAARRGRALPHAQRQLRQPHADRGRAPRGPPAGARWRELPRGSAHPRLQGDQGAGADAARAVQPRRVPDQGVSQPDLRILHGAEAPEQFLTSSRKPSAR